MTDSVFVHSYFYGAVKNWSTLDIILYGKLYLMLDYIPLLN